MPEIKKKHVVGALTGGVIALCCGTAAQQGYIPHWESGAKQEHVARHLPFDRPGVITVCDGLTNYDIPGLKEGDYYTAAMCADALGADLPKYNKGIAACLPADFEVSDHQHAAMISFAYNVGTNTFCKSSVGREFRAGHREAACRNMGQFTRANGVVLKGLHNRRYDKFYGEIAWCLRDD